MKRKEKKEGSMKEIGEKETVLMAPMVSQHRRRSYTQLVITAQLKLTVMLEPSVVQAPERSAAATGPSADTVSRAVPSSLR